MKRKEWTSKRLFDEFNIYTKKSGKGFNYFILNKVVKIMNQLELNRLRRYWIIVFDKESNLELKITGYNPTEFDMIYNLATKKYWQFENKDKAIEYLVYLGDKYNLNIKYFDHENKLGYLE